LSGFLPYASLRLRLHNIVNDRRQPAHAFTSSAFSSTASSLSYVTKQDPKFVIRRTTSLKISFSGIKI
jgi:hypothetical protein